MDNWIGVNDRLPESGERVLMLIDWRTVFEGYYSEDSKGWFRNAMPVSKIFDGRVTAWAPLPDPPTK